MCPTWPSPSCTAPHRGPGQFGGRAAVQQDGPSSQPRSPARWMPRWPNWPSEAGPQSAPESFARKAVEREGGSSLGLAVPPRAAPGSTLATQCRGAGVSEAASKRQRHPHRLGRAVCDTLREGKTWERIQQHHRGGSRSWVENFIMGRDSYPGNDTMYFNTLVDPWLYTQSTARYSRKIGLFLLLARRAIFLE
jgi:hypothetical protein